eukprot:9141615-Alexandrium_andersonii.AAC.1
MCIPRAARFRKLRPMARQSAAAMSAIGPAPGSPQNQSRLAGYPRMTSCPAPVTARRLREKKRRWP